jgi:hypothetical protein
MLGVLGTVAVQSSSTFTSIIIAMVAAGSESPRPEQIISTQCNTPHSHITNCLYYHKH